MYSKPNSNSFDEDDKNEDEESAKLLKNGVPDDIVTHSGSGPDINEDISYDENSTDFSRQKYITFFSIVILSAMMGYGIAQWRLIYRHLDGRSNDEGTTFARHPIITGLGTYKPETKLPRRIITVVGLEASGTKLVASIISDALGVPWRDGRGPVRGTRSPDHEVQHVTLPHGSTCTSYPEAKIEEALYPAECVRSKSAADDAALPESCKRSGIHEFHKYPPRFFLDVSAHTRWYLRRGVDVIVVVVVRDLSISMLSRAAPKKRGSFGYRSRCANEKRSAKDNEIGINIINKALKNLNSNGLILVSYETLTQLGEPYIQQLFRKLGIKSEYSPGIVTDQNAQYLKNSEDEKKRVLRKKNLI